MILSPQDKENILQIAQEVFKTPLEMWAYGSRVDGTAHDTSDLDLVLRTKNSQPIDGQEIVEFKERIENSNIPILVQVFDWSSIPESFHQNILKNYIVLYDSQK